MSYALGLPAALARWGLTVELVPGWETRSAGSFNPAGAVCHWTAGPRGATGRPSLSIVVNGRPDLAGPLCNVYLDRQGVAVVVAAGRANHAGMGGWKGLVGNSSVFGTEAECGGDGDWTDAQRWAYPRVNAAYCDLGGFGLDTVCGHNEWAPDRKIDIRDYTMPVMRSQLAALQAAGPGGDDMANVAQKDWDDLVLAVGQIRDVLGARGGLNTAAEDSVKDHIEAWLAPIERYDNGPDGKPKTGPDGKPVILKTPIRQELANLSNAVAALKLASGGTAGELVAALKPIIAEAVAAGQKASDDAEAEQIVELMAARLGGQLASS